MIIDIQYTIRIGCPVPDGKAWKETGWGISVPYTAATDKEIQEYLVEEFRERLREILSGVNA